MKYAKLTDGIVTQIQPNEEEGFIECPDSVVCGMIKNGENYDNPPQTAGQARTKKHNELRKNAIDASLEPVAAIGFMWNSSEASRDRMSAKALHMEKAGITESQSWDIDNVMHTVTVAEVWEVSNAITNNIELVGHHYREKKNEYLACDDNVICINAVVW